MSDLIAPRQSGSSPADLNVADRLARAMLLPFMPAGASARLSIAIFHRVLPEPDPMAPDEMDRERFNELCAWLARWYQVLPLDEAVQRLQRGALSARALAITFDDGYADNHDVALPVLQRHGLCATFFIANGFLDGGLMWNDSVIESIRRAPSSTLDLRGVGLAGIESVDLATVDSRRRAIGPLLNAVKYLGPTRRQGAIQEIAARADVRLPNDLMMSSAQVRALAQAGMQIGAHTVTHPILATLDAADVRKEMARGKDDLESLLGQPVTLFAYPNGKPGKDYRVCDVESVRQVGFRAAVSTSHGAARTGDDVFQLPRFTPWDRGRWAFYLRMLQNLRQPATRV